MTAYATTTEAATYFQQRLHTSAWTNANSEQRTAALQYATDLIDQLNFAGSKTDSAQELEFPRGTDTVVPDKIKKACYEITYALLDGRDPQFDIENMNRQGSVFQDARSFHDVRFQPEHLMHGIPSSLAWRYLKPYLRSGRSVKLSRSN